MPTSAEPPTSVRSVQWDYREVFGRNEAQTRSVLRVRDVQPFAMDEPLERGGTNSGPTPQEAVLAALAGEQGVLIHLLREQLDFSYRAVDLHVLGVIDRSHRPYAKRVTLEVRLDTDESPDRMAELRARVEERCPVLNLMRDAGVELTVNWSRAATGGGDQPI